jgi:hypothetical protein
MRLRCSRPARSDTSSTARFRYGLQLPEQKNYSLALGLAATRHSKSISGRNWKPMKVWRPSESSLSFGKPGWNRSPKPSSPRTRAKEIYAARAKRLVAKYMEQVAPKLEPTAVELDGHGSISGVAVRGRVDVLDVEDRVIDFKTASRRPVSRPTTPFNSLRTGRSLPARAARCESIAW